MFVSIYPKNVFKNTQTNHPVWAVIEPKIESNQSVKAIFKKFQMKRRYKLRREDSDN